jgi:putative ABC transport system ATP-binding protein
MARQPTVYSGEVVRVDDVHRAFGQGQRAVHVLRGVDLSLQAGELIALYGPSGSGKTTLLNLIGALDHPTQGDIYIQDKNILKLREGRRARLRRRQIGFIFQNYTLMPTYTALENIDLALRLPGFGIFERNKRAKTTLEVVGLSAWATHMPEQLSGGQRQRVAIARALALRPPLILADEPTSGLDTRTARRIMALFRGIAERQGTAFIIVSHDPIVVDYVDTAYDLVEGRVIARPKEEQTADERV